MGRNWSSEIVTRFTIEKLGRGVLPPIRKSFDNFKQILYSIFIQQWPLEIAFGSIQRLIVISLPLYEKQGRKRPLDTPKRMIKRREREGKREKER